MRSGSIWASARNIAGRSTPRCCCGRTVDSRADFDRWVQAQKQAARDDAALSADAIEGRRVFNRDGVRQLSCDCGHGGDGSLRAGPDAFDEPRNHRRRDRFEQCRGICAGGCKIRRRSNLVRSCPP